MKQIIVVILFANLTYNFVSAAQRSYSERMADTVLSLWKTGNITSTWTYEQGVVLKGLDKVWRKTKNDTYFKYIQKSLDLYIKSNGSIGTYNMDEYNLDMIKPGSITLTMYNLTEDKKYYTAAQTLREQLKTHPRTHEGGFWHKKKYPYQMWLDGLYMAQPFYTEWSVTFNETESLDDVANQFVWMESHARDNVTGLLYHGWDESKTQVWAKQTGHSPMFWGRAMGWFGVALVDVLDYFPKQHKRYKEIFDILQRYSVAVQKVQDNNTGLWWDVLDYPERAGNYLESSASCMFAYTFAKAVHNGYLASEPYLAIAKNAFDGIVKYFIETNSNNDHLVLNNTVRVSSLDQDATYEYYIKQQIVKNDPKGVAPFLMISSEIDQ